jgi:hypothetical protein
LFRSHKEEAFQVPNGYRNVYFDPTKAAEVELLQAVRVLVKGLWHIFIKERVVFGVQLNQIPLQISPPFAT